MIDPSRCTASRDGEIFGELCQQPATHRTPFGRRCEKHAEAFKIALRDPNSLANVLACSKTREPLRARTEEEIARFVTRLDS